MENIEFRKFVAQAALGACLIFGALAVHAQTPPALQYKVVDGLVYAYEPSSPESLYLVPNLTPQQVGLGGEAEAQALAAAAAQNQAQIYAGQSPYGNGVPYGDPGAFVTGNQGYGFPFMPPPLPAKPAASNSALPAITFREPVFSPQNLPRMANPIGGLPRYPGKNYSPGYRATPW